MDERMMEGPNPMDIDQRDMIVASETLPDDFPPLEDFGNSAAPGSAPADGGTNLEAIYDVPVKVQAVLGRSRIAIGALMQLKAGAVIELDRRVGEPVDIFVNNRLIARGEVVMIDNSLGVTLTELVRQER
jgi:flagellar motor switch protein FliN/FliY